MEFEENREQKEYEILKDLNNKLKDFSQEQQKDDGDGRQD